ncbi:MAG: hypothetical protein AAF602_30590 [Myxococcota bacterium]
MRLHPDLLAAGLAAPHDDAPRLVLADGLEDRHPEDVAMAYGERVRASRSEIAGLRWGLRCRRGPKIRQSGRRVRQSR